jgi:hypothetical protein
MVKAGLLGPACHSSEGQPSINRSAASAISKCLCRRTIAVRFGAFSVLAKNIARSCTVLPCEATRYALDKLIIFHRPLNATAALLIPPCGAETELIGGIAGTGDVSGLAP